MANNNPASSNKPPSHHRVEDGANYSLTSPSMPTNFPPVDVITCTPVTAACYTQTFVFVQTKPQQWSHFHDIIPVNMDRKNPGRSPHFAGFHLTFATSTSSADHIWSLPTIEEVLSRNIRISESKIAR